MCTVMGSTGGGAAWLASTSDNPYREGPRKPVVFDIAANGRRIVHTPCLRLEKDGSFTGLGSDRGLNDAGFAWTRAWTVPAEEENPAAPDPVEWFMRLGAECATVAEAVAFISQTPKRMGCQGNYMLADGAGGFACLEVGYATVRAAVSTSGAILACAARANKFVLPEMAALDASETANPVYASTSDIRRARAERLLAGMGGAADLERWQAILSDTENLRLPPETEHGPSICSAGKAHGTVSAEIAHPASSSFWYTYGWPDIRAALGSEYTGAPLVPWGKWRRFDPGAMTEPGAYTTWLGELTPLGRAWFGE